MDDAKTRELTELLGSIDNKDVEKLARQLVPVVARRLAGEYHMPASLVTLKALALFKLALDAKAKGNRLAILSPDDEIVQEIVGFEPTSEVLQSRDS